MEIRKMTEQPVLSIRTSTPAQSLPKVLGECYDELMAFMAEKGIAFAGPPFSLYYNMDMSNLDVEIGFPAAYGGPCPGRISAGKLPACEAVCALHKGPYQTIEKTYAEVTRFIEERKLSMESFMWESYLNDPSQVKPEDLETEICFPLRS